MRCCELESAILSVKVKAAERVLSAQEGQARKYQAKIRQLERNGECQQNELEVTSLLQSSWLGHFGLLPRFYRDLIRTGPVGSQATV